MIYEKLLNIQRDVKAPKGQYNSFGKYKYRSMEDICEAIKPYLDREKAVLLIHDEIETHGDRFYVKAIARLLDTEDGSYTESVAYAREPETQKGKDESQVTGTCSSYARKYALNALFLLDDTKDADTDENYNERKARASKDSAKKESDNANTEDETEKMKAQYVSDIDIKAINSYCTTNGISIDKVVKAYKLTSIKQMTVGIMMAITNPKNLRMFQERYGED